MSCAARQPELSLAEAAERSGWPAELVCDTSKHPRVVQTASEFLSFCCYADHSQAQMCVLPDGIRKLGLEDSAPRALLEASARHKTAVGCVMEAIDREAGGPGDGLDGDVFWWPAGSDQRKEKTKGSLRDRLVRCQADAKPSDLVYIAEISRDHRTRHKLTGERSRQLSTLDVRDLVGGKLPMWDRGHFFVGGEGAGSCLHIDQAWWSNVAKNFLGYKLVALWGPGESSEALRRCSRELFRKPLSAAQREVLSTAATIALMKPGDVVSFTGGLPHATVVVGDSLNLTAYESNINWSPQNADLLLRGAARSDGRMVMLPRQTRVLLEDVAIGARDVGDHFPSAEKVPCPGGSPEEFRRNFLDVLAGRRRTARVLDVPVRKRYYSPSSQASSSSSSRSPPRRRRRTRSPMGKCR